MSETILIVDDEKDIRTILKDILEDEGYDVLTAAHSEEAYHHFSQHHPALVILDIWLENSDQDGVEILQQLHQNHPDTTILMISGHGNVEMAVKTIQLGAYDFIEKPFKIDRLINTVDRALQSNRMKRENARLKTVSQQANIQSLLGESTAIKTLEKRITQLSESNARVLVSGPRGSGKSSIATMLARMSVKRKAPLILDAGGLSDDDWDVFNKDVYPIIILDHIQNAPKGVQDKLVSLLQNNQAELPRLISVQDHAFDPAFSVYLKQQLAVETLTMPGLDQRMNDLPLLLADMVKRTCHKHAVPALALNENFIKAIQHMDWPGHAGQLNLACQWAVELALVEGSRELQDYHLPLIQKQTQNSPSGQAVASADYSDQTLKQARECFERDYLLFHYKAHEGNITRMAKSIGMDRAALHRKMKSIAVHD